MNFYSSLFNKPEAKVEEQPVVVQDAAVEEPKSDSDKKSKFSLIDARKKVGLPIFGVDYKG